MDKANFPPSEIAQYRFLIELDDKIRPLIDPAEITLAAATLLGRYPGVNRCAYADVEEDQDTFNPTGNYSNGVPSIIGRYKGDGFGAEFLRLSREGVPYIVEDSESDPRIAAAREAYRLTQIRAVVSVPIVKAGRFVAGMAVHQATPRAWQADEVRLIALVANRCWESIERNRIARELRDSEARFRTITNAMPQMVWTALPNGEVDFCNEQWYDFTGIPRESSENNRWEEMVHPEDREYVRRLWSHSIATGAPYESSHRLRHHSGDYRWTLVRALPVQDDAGAILHWMGTNTDIHAQKLAEEALQDANRREDEFLAMLAHELRNPLAPISAAADLLAMAKMDAARVQELSKIIARQIGHVTGLVDDLLDVSRVTRSLVPTDIVAVDLRQIMADAVEQPRPLIEQRRHRLSMRLPPEGVFVDGDRKRLVQVLANLLNKATKYTPDGGQIGLAVEANDHHVMLSVADSGIGMTPALARQAFDLFSQADRTADRSQGGLGLGLALVKSLVEQHHGTITAHSKGIGQGSNFTIRLPRIDARPRLSAGKTALQASPTGLRVMVVDDNADAARTIAMYLEALGNEVMVEHHPETALERARTEIPDVCLLDIGLPGMDGNELARRLRAQPETQKSVLVALTGYGQEQDRKKTTAAGFDYHFVKPIDGAKLSALLADIGRK